MIIERGRSTPDNINRLRSVRERLRQATAPTVALERALHGALAPWLPAPPPASPRAFLTSLDDCLALLEDALPPRVYVLSRGRIETTDTLYKVSLGACEASGIVIDDGPIISGLHEHSAAFALLDAILSDLIGDQVEGED